MGTRLSVNEAAKTESAQVVRHLRRGIGSAEQRGDAWTQIAMTEARRADARSR